MEGKDNFNGLNEQCESSLKVGIYSVWDTQLKQYDSPFSCSISHLDDYLSIMVNDVQSRFYGKEEFFIVVKLGEFDSNTGALIQCSQPEHVGMLSKYIRTVDRNMQIIIKTLNFLPQGYFKMPQEMKQNIQNDIDSAIKDYVANYVIPDMDVSSEKLKMLEKDNTDLRMKLDAYLG